MIGNMTKQLIPELTDNHAKSLGEVVDKANNKLIDDLLMNKLMGKYKKEFVQYLKEKYPEEFI